LKVVFIYFRLKSRDLMVAAFSISELPEGSADPVELAARVEDGRKQKYFIPNQILFVFCLLFSYF